MTSNVEEKRAQVRDTPERAKKDGKRLTIGKDIRRELEHVG